MLRSLSRLLAELGCTPGAAAARRKAVPRLEVLENRWVPSTIAGTVYNDVNNTGVFEIGNPIYANNPITLENAAGASIASTTTDANGHYAFTINQTIDTAPATQEQDLTFGPSPTDTPLSQQINQFDPSLGTLTSVEIDLVGQLSSDVKVDNLDALASQVQAQIQGAVTLQGPGGVNLNAAIQQTTETATVAASDGTMGFTGVAAHDFGAKQSQATQAITLTAGAADLSGFVGTGKATLTENGSADVCVCGPGNLLSLVNSTISGHVKVVYHYQPSNALTPGQYTVVQTQNPPGTVDAVNSSNGVPTPPGTPADTIPVTLPPGGDSLQNNFGEKTTPDVIPPVIPPIVPPVVPPIVPPIVPPVTPPVTPPLVPPVVPPPPPTPAVTKFDFLSFTTWEWGW
jgi:SdrD B-like domain